jgi:hypothetical protein
VNADRILQSFHEHKVDCILIGGMNFLLRHQPVLTFDVDFWVRDNPDNLKNVNRALQDLGASWGRSEKTWGPVPSDAQWLTRQVVFCLTSEHGAVDIFREVEGLPDFDACWQRSSVRQTEAGTPFRSLADEDMLACQLALNEGDRRLDRVAYLQKLLRK